MSNLGKSIFASIAILPLLAATPATFAQDKPKGDHPERRCQPERQNCNVTKTNQDTGSLNQDTGPSPYDNPWGDHPERKCQPEREYCPED
jgi:hypothetical protein